MIHLRRTLLILVALSSSSALADTTPQPLPFAQDWSNTGLIDANDDWSGVPGIVGYKGADLTTANDVDAQTVVAPTAETTTSVLANQGAATSTSGNVGEFELTNPTIGFQGSGGADAPHIILTLDTTGVAGVRIRYNVRDLDAGTMDDAAQQVALQYRVGTSGDFTNVPAGYVADATEGPLLNTLVTPINVVLPAAVGNQSVVQIRVITTNATGSDEWVGIDDIQVTDATTSPTATGAADPTSAPRGGAVTLTATVTPGEIPASTGLTVTCDLTGIGGSATQAFVDDGTGGDTTADDNTFTFAATVDATATAGAKTLPCTVADAEARSSTFDIMFTVNAVCGDGIVEGTETCDDTGTTAGDGCSDTCTEEPGYTCTGMPSVCADIDECADMTDTCDALATCTNVAGSFTCACSMGYDGDGTTTGTGCTDIDECADTTTCDENASCTNGDGDFTCACNAGYDGDGTTCADVDECADGTDDCDENASCANTDGGFTCTCAAGYAGDGTTCMPDCGDGIVTSPEACDDGNMADSDGCTANCTVETGYTCTGEPSTCTPDDDGSGSGNGNNGGEDDGGGCCSSSSHPGSAILLALFVMIGVRRRQRR